jgi:hypothetical protein
MKSRRCYIVDVRGVTRAWRPGKWRAARAFFTMARADDFARFILRRGRIGRAKVIDTRVVIADVTRRPGP